MDSIAVEIGAPKALGSETVIQPLLHSAADVSLRERSAVAVFARTPCHNFQCLDMLCKGQYSAIPSLLQQPFDNIAFHLTRTLKRDVSVAGVSFTPGGPKLFPMSKSDLLAVPPAMLSLWRQYQINTGCMSMLAGRTILLVGGGCQQKTSIIVRLRETGLRVVLADFDPDCPGSKLADDFVHLSTAKDPKLFDTAAEEVIQKLAQLNIHVDGVAAFWEYATPLAALVCRKLGLPGNSFESASCARNKLLTYKRLSTLERTKAYVPFFMQINSVADISSMPEASFPLVLKYCTGAAAVGIATAHDKAEGLDLYRSIVNSLNAASGPEVGVEYGIQMKAVEQLTGSELDVDIALYNGKVVRAILSDNGPVLQPSCQEVSYATPSRLEPAVQETIINATRECAAGLGLTNGVFNVEWFWTSSGPKLIEINARPAGAHIPSALLSVHGFDIVLTHALISLGIEPVVLPTEPHGVLHAVIIYQSRHAGKVDSDLLRRLGAGDGRVTADFLARPSEGDSFEKPFGFISVRGRDESEARIITKEVLEKIGVGLDDYRFVV